MDGPKKETFQRSIKLKMLKQDLALGYEKV